MELCLINLLQKILFIICYPLLFEILLCFLPFSVCNANLNDPNVLFKYYNAFSFPEKYLEQSLNATHSMFNHAFDKFKLHHVSFYFYFYFFVLFCFLSVCFFLQKTKKNPKTSKNTNITQ